MPSGKTHDAITFFLTAPVSTAAYVLTGEISTAVLIAVTFFFGGLMFGPDLDTVSRQYSRWGPFKFLWLPYRKFFSHRSRWSHGLIFGTLFRVIYFMGVLTLASFLGAYIGATYLGGDLPRLDEAANAWQTAGEWVRSTLGQTAPYIAFAGFWLGAASHTLTDMAGSYVKTGRIGEFL
jgi:uncharacterized metal-binding protein